MEVKIIRSEELKELHISKDDDLHNVIQLFEKDQWSSLYRMFCFNNVKVPIGPITLQIELKVDIEQKLGEDECIPYAVLYIDGKKSFIITSFDVYIFDILESEMKKIYQDKTLSNNERQAMKVEARTKAFVYFGSRLLRSCCKSFIQENDIKNQMEWYDIELSEHIEREISSRNKYEIKVPLKDPILI